MTIERIRSACDAQPFRPFIMHLADGREIPVHHREFIMTVPSGRTVVVCQPDDTVEIINPSLVANIDVEP